MRFTKIALLFALLFVGAGLEATYQLRSHVGIRPIDWRIFGGRFTGPSYEFVDEITEPLAPGHTVNVDNAFGSVRVSRSQGPTQDVTVRLRKVVFLPTEEKARAFAQKIALERAVTDGALRLSTNRRSIEREGGDWDTAFETHIEVAVPAAATVRVNNEHGEVAVADVASAFVSNAHDAVRVERVAGPVEIQTEHGDVTVATVQGTLRVKARFGDVTIQDVTKESVVEAEHGDVYAARTAGLKVTVQHGDMKGEHVGGDVEVRGEHAGVNLTDVTGRALVDTAFRDVELDRVGGEAIVKCKHGTVKATHVQGAFFGEAAFEDVELEDVGGPVEVTVEHGGVTAARFGKGAKIKSSGNDVRLDAFSGALDVETERGAVELNPAGPIEEPITVRSRFGGIELAVPPGSRFNLEASSERGDVEVDVPGLTLSVPASGSPRDGAPGVATGTIGGGGKLVKLHAQHGDVSVRGASGSRASND